MPTTDPTPHLHSLKLTTPPPTSPISTLLGTLIALPLTTLNHTPTQISLVSHLTRQNTHTITLTGLSSLIHHPSRTYGAPTALSTLFANLTAQNQRINTNEPILLIYSSTLSPTHLRDVADAAANLLRCAHHVRPVRVYAGNFNTTLSTTTDVDVPEGYAGSEGYSLSLLNVVNTDIGGPGMVQLLDMVDWEGEGAVRVERWDGSGWNLVERWDFGGRDVQEGEGSEMGGSEEGEWESEVEVEAEDEDKQEDGAAESKVEVEEGDHIESASIPDASDSHQLLDEPTAGAVEEPKESQAISEPETDRPQLRTIKHPSWEREQDNESLLDMIAKQSKRLPVSKSGNAYATAAAKEKAGLEGEDEYEVL